MFKTIAKLVRSCSLENPNTPLSASNVDSCFDWGTKSASGIVVNESTVLTYAAVWRSINLKSDSLAKLPLCVFQGPIGNKHRARTHPAFELLKWKSSETQTAFNFKKLMMSWQLLQGNAYAEIRRNGNGDPVELIPRSPSGTFPIKTDGRLSYMVTGEDGRMRNVLAINMLHFRGLGDELEGFSVISKASDSFGLGMGAARYGSKFFANDARPGVVIEYPGRLSDKAIKNMSDSWVAKHGGINNNSRPALMEEGSKIHTLSMPNKDAQFLETRQFEIREVANWFGIPAHKLGDSSKTSFSSLEQENQSYLDESLDPDLVNWEMECRDKLLTDDEKSSGEFAIEFVRAALLRADLASRYNSYSIALREGVLNPNEVRALEGMNSYEGGEIYTRPLNQGAVDSDGEIGDDTDDNESARFKLLHDTTERMKKRLTKSKNKDDQREFVLSQIRSVTEAIGMDNAGTDGKHANELTTKLFNEV